MSSARSWSRRLRIYSFLALVLSIGAIGCGGKEPLVLLPVSGTVKLGGAPMPMGTVEFHPDAGKGNTFKGKATAAIKSDGKYTLVTDGQEGAPAGWYKVTVSGHGMPDPSKMEAGKMPTPPVVQGRYAKADSTPFNIEVKEGAPAGSYDLSLSK
jgi:hypothetical protein